MKKIFLLFLFLSISVTSIAETKKITLALNWKAEPQFGGFYQAHIVNKISKASYSLDVIEGGSGTPTIQMLANKKIDFGIVSAEEILINNDRNPKNKIIALFAVYQTNPQILMCHKNRNFKNISDLYNSSVTLSQQSGLTYAQYLKNKFPQSKAKIVPYLGGVTNFIKDENLCQQGFATSEPLLVKKSGIEPSVFYVSDEGFNPYTTVLATHSDLLEKQPELIAFMVELTKNGWSDYLKNPDATNKFMSEINKSMDLETFKQSAVAQISLIQPKKDFKIGTMTNERWQTLAQQLLDLKIIHAKPKMSDLYR